MEKYEALNKALKPLDSAMDGAFALMKKAKVYEPFKNALYHALRSNMQANFKSKHKVKVFGAENVPQEGGVILAINHQSWLDAQLVSAMSPRKVRFLAKSMFVDWPVLRQTIDLADGIFIKRGGDEDGLRSVAELLESGDCALFPWDCPARVVRFLPRRTPVSSSFPSRDRNRWKCASASRSSTASTT